MKKRIHIYTATKRSIVLMVLEGKYTVEQAAQIMRVQPATINQWLKKYGPAQLLASNE